MSVDYDLYAGETRAWRSSRGPRGDMDVFALPSRVALSDQTDFALSALHFGGDAMWIWRTARWSLRRWRRVARMQRASPALNSIITGDPRQVRAAEQQADRAAVRSAMRHEKLRDGLEKISVLSKPVLALRTAAILIETPDVAAHLVPFEWDRLGTVAQAKAKLLEDLTVYAVLVDGRRRRLRPDELQLSFAGQSLELEQEPGPQPQLDTKLNRVAAVIAKCGVANAVTLAKIEVALADYLVQLYTDDALRNEGMSLAQEIHEIWSPDRLHTVVKQLEAGIQDQLAGEKLITSRAAWGITDRFNVREASAALANSNPAVALAHLLLRPLRRNVTIQLQVVPPPLDAETLHAATPEEIELHLNEAAPLSQQTGRYEIEFSGDLADRGNATNPPKLEANSRNPAIERQRGLEKLRRVRSAGVLQLQVPELGEQWMLLAEELFERCVDVDTQQR